MFVIVLNPDGFDIKGHYVSSSGGYGGREGLCFLFSMSHSDRFVKLFLISHLYITTSRSIFLLYISVLISRIVFPFLLIYGSNSG